MFQNYTILDLTHELSSTIPTWEGSCGFESTIITDYYQGGLRIQKYALLAGIGTHIDAPSHCVPGAQSISDICLSQLISPLRVIDIFHKSSAFCEIYEITVEDIKAYEEKYGIIKSQDFVLLYTGWGKRWNSPALYRNLNNNNIMEFPTLTLEAASYLLDKKIIGIGIDTLSPDKDQSSFPVHHLLLSAGKYIVENIAYKENLPHRGAYIAIIPLKIKSGTESPVRAFAFIN